MYLGHMWCRSRRDNIWAFIVQTWFMEIQLKLILIKQYNQLQNLNKFSVLLYFRQSLMEGMMESPSSSSFVEDSNQSDDQQSPSPSFYPASILQATCSICGDAAATHLHYGAVSCYSCRAFFRWEFRNHPLLT